MGQAMWPPMHAGMLTWCCLRGRRRWQRVKRCVCCCARVVQVRYYGVDMNDESRNVRARWSGWLMILFGTAMALAFAAIAVFVSRMAENANPVRLAALPVTLS